MVSREGAIRAMMDAKMALDFKHMVNNQCNVLISGNDEVSVALDHACDRSSNGHSLLQRGLEAKTLKVLTRNELSEIDSPARAMRSCKECHPTERRRPHDGA